MKSVDVIIVGAGAAGMTAALYMLRAGKRVALLERAVVGGQASTSPWIENYPGVPACSGLQLAQIMQTQLEQAGGCILHEEVLRVTANSPEKQVETHSQIYMAPALILATGAQKRRLGLKEEDAYLGRGLSYCSTCDGPLFRGKTVAVVGGGNTACTEALHLASLCRNVFLLHRRETFRAEMKLIDRLHQQPNIHIRTNVRVTALAGDERLTGVQLNVKGRNEWFPLDGLFLAIGSDPDTALVRGQIALDAKGAIEAGEDGRTDHPLVYAAGDCRRKRLRQLVTAAADGANAAMSALEDLSSVSFRAPY